MGAKKIDPSLIGLLGRYEFQSGTSDKFWTIRFNKLNGTYDTCWGRNGRPPQGQKAGLTGVESLKKIQEKVNKGYILREAEEQIEAAQRVQKKRAERKDTFDFMDELRKI